MIYRNLFVIVAMFALSACGGGGGGGGGGGPTTTPLTGNFHIVAFSGNAIVPAALPRSAWGTATGTSTGDFTITATSHIYGDANSPTSLSPLTYQSSVDGGGKVRLAVQGATWYEGGISDNGDVVVLSFVLDQQDPGMLVMIRQTTGANASTFTGAYWNGAISAVDAIGPSTDPVGLSIFAIETANGAGALSALGGANLNGSISSAVSESSVYTVGSVGQSTILSTTTPNSGSIGGITGDGDFGTWGGNTFSPPGTFPGMSVLVRGANTTTTSTFSGPYHFAAMEYSALTGIWVSSSGTASADGAGAVTLTGLRNIGGGVSGGTIGLSYQVDANGIMSADRAGTTEGLGGTISANGRYVVLSGGGATGSSPFMITFCRQ